MAFFMLIYCVIGLLLLAALFTPFFMMALRITCSIRSSFMESYRLTLFLSSVILFVQLGLTMTIGRNLGLAPYLIVPLLILGICYGTMIIPPISERVGFQQGFKIAFVQYAMILLFLVLPLILMIR